MKCKFFGATAKLAMAILAVGAMFTSCYDSENGDVTKPYKAPDAVYTFVVTVTNDITGNPVTGATVTATATSVINWTEVGNGVYQGVITNDQSGANKMPAEVTINVAAKAGEYDAASAKAAVAEITNGQAVTCYANVVVNPTKFEPEGLQVEVSNSSASDTNSYTGDETYESENENVTPDKTLDIINKTGEPMLVSRKIKHWIGVKYMNTVAEAGTRAIDVVNEIDQYIKNVENAPNLTTEFTESAIEEYSFSLPVDVALQKISVKYIYDDKDYTFTYNGKSYTAKTRRITNVIFSNTFVPLNMYHGHGHGHGHGGDLNAGGGIFE